MMSTANMSDIASTSPQTRLAFLRSLAENDGFRAELERNPAAALASFGLHVESEQIPARVSLPNKEDIRLSLESLPSSHRSIDSFDPETRAWAGFIGHD